MTKSKKMQEIFINDTTLEILTELKKIYKNCKYAFRKKYIAILFQTWIT